MQLRVTFASLPGPEPGPGHSGSRSRRDLSADIAAAALVQQRGSYRGKKSRPNFGSCFPAAEQLRRPEKERNLRKLNTESTTARPGDICGDNGSGEPIRGRGPRPGPASDGKESASGAGSREKLSQCRGEARQGGRDSVELRRLVGRGVAFLGGVAIRFERRSPCRTQPMAVEKPD